MANSGGGLAADSGSTLIDFVDPAFATINGVLTELTSSVQFHTTSFKSSFTPQGLTVSGFASATGRFEPCSPLECTGEATQYRFFPERRWSYNAHFRTFPDVPTDDPYYISDLRVTAAPELDSLVLSLAGMTGLGCFGFFRKWRHFS